MAPTRVINQDALDRIHFLDEKLSQRFISLDPSGYFIIKVDESSQELVVEHYTNNIDDLGRAIDPETGKPLECQGGGGRTPKTVYRGHSAKEVGIKLTERNAPYPLSRLDHALYLGRELQRAEDCLLNTKHYIQD